MAATFTTLGSQAFAAHEETERMVRNPDFSGRLHNEPTAVAADFGIDLKTSVEAKSAKARAQARWRMLRSVVHTLEFPRIKMSEDVLKRLKGHVPVLDGEFLSSKPVISPDWVSHLQDFWFGRAASRHHTTVMM